MGYTYTPTYYSGLQDTIASLCKSILPFAGFRAGRRLTADQAAARRHAEALKWQQDSFHRILHLSALHREGIVPASDVDAFRAGMLATLAAAPAPPAHPDQPAILRDKLLFLQELLYAKCISAAEYNYTKRPLVQRLASFGVVVECPDADVGDGGAAAPASSSSVEEWSEIDLRDPPPAAPASDKPKHKAFVPPWKSRGKKEQDANRPPLAQVDQNAASVLMAESSPSGKPEKGKRRHLTAMFHNGGENKEPAASMEGTEEKDVAKGKKKSSWGFDGLKKWKKAAGNEEATAGGERPECAAPRSSYSECRLEASPAVAKDAKRAKKKLHTTTSDDDASDLANDKVLVENTKKELSRIQAELSSTNRNLNFSDQQIEAISTRLPVDKSDLKTFFPKAWCDEHGDNVINAAKKEFKEHVEEMEKQRDIGGDDGWVAFGDNHDENFNPRAFSHHQAAVKGGKVNDSLSGSEHLTNPFYDEKNPFLNPSYD
ncbi:hypothetical protein E2562_008808 [Oryza meyeriana var. granulata]|uniref:Uncharacterized protein n=1 Tax=Oryza meyeriana var. granulata TaxID=110450 RepID=A0A6G1D093_9ORYZ|nr:hypothetical protein E2562_008808 [Oryza meyeriana var. granulata]